MKRIILLVAALFLVPSALPAQEAARAGAWSIGTSLTYPIAGIYQLHIGYRLDDEHEVFFGPAYQNFRSGSITSHAYTLILGHRYYLWRKLHVETELWPAFNRMYSSVTDSHYPGVELWAEVKIGYDVALSRRLYVRPAPGIGFGILRTNRPPHFADDVKSPIFAPQLVLGLSL